MPDGVFVEPRGAPRDAPLEFHPLRPPEDEDVEALLRKTASRVIAMLRKRGRLDAGERANDLDALGALQATSLMSSPPAPRDAYPPQASRRNAFLDGFSLHANTHLRGEDREGIERLCMYGARGPLAVSRLRELPDGRLVYRMKRKAASGADELVLQPLELLRKLVALVPPPRVHLTRFHGVFAPNAGARHRVVPEREGEEPTCASASAADAVPVPPQEPHLLRPLADEAPRNRVPWAALLRRSFEIDVFQCPQLPGPHARRRVPRRADRDGEDPRPPRPALARAADRPGAGAAATRARRVTASGRSKSPSSHPDLDRRAEPREISENRAKMARDRPSGSPHRPPAAAAGTCAPARFRGLIVL